MLTLRAVLQPPIPTADPLPKGRILIVDDVADNRDILARRLERQGFACVQAGSGLEALYLLDAAPFDAVLLDVMMPDMGGLEVLRKIRASGAACDVPVIMVTAKVETTDIVDALALGANDYVMKPINFPVLLARLSNQVERRRITLELQRSHQALLDTNTRLLDLNERLFEENRRRIQADEKSSYLAYHDPLTGLANRRACDERLRDCLRVANDRLAILFVDLDGFKNVNDALGHAIGDLVLHDVAAAMRAAIAETDFLVRLGGDEFCVLHVSDDRETSANSLADALIGTIRKERLIEGQKVFVGASIGIAFADREVSEASELLKRADLAMYRAKADGRGIWRRFRPEMDERVRQRRAVEIDLRDALARGEFELHYQPIVDLGTNRIRGFEALLRWNRLALGFVAPEVFVPIAEETGLIVPIGEWVLRQACADAATWPSDLSVAVNVSPVQFQNKQFLAAVVGSMAASRIDAERLELELTESALLDNSSETLDVLRQCRDLGIRLAMDDFGTGYSSLGYLRSFPFDKVKIDKSFVSGFADFKDARAVVRAVVGLGESFGMTTTAEGVETQEQLDFVRSEGCREVQGYLFGRPQPAALIPDLLARHDELSRGRELPPRADARAEPRMRVAGRG